MSRIDPKWISYDDSKLTIIQNNDDENELSIRDDITLNGVSVSYVNGATFDVRTDTEGIMPEDVDRSMKGDFWIQIPDFTV